MAQREITHRERIQACLAGEIPDRTPVALWRHFPVDDQDPVRLAAATVSFHKFYDFDLVKVTPASSFCTKDWGTQDEWRGGTEGTREYIHRVIQQPEDWSRLPLLDPLEGHLGAQIKALRIIVSEVGKEVPVIQTIFNPLSQAKYLAGGQTLLTHLRKYPQAVHDGLKIIVESTQNYLVACRKVGIDGIFFAEQHAQYGLLSVDEFAAFGKAYDLQLLEALGDCWLNMLHLHGEDVMFDQVVDYPVQIINWHDRDTYPTLIEAQQRYAGVVCGGLQRERTMVLGTPEQVSAEARDAIQTTGGKRFILGTGCVMPITAPTGNIWAARHSVDKS